MPIVQPTFIPVAFASNTNDKNIIPETNANPTNDAAASWNNGFPQETSDPIAAGGVYVSRKDFNGLLYQITAHLFFAQSGSLFGWSATLDYNVGAAVLRNGGEYRCVAANGISSTVQDPATDVNNVYWKPLNLFLTDILYPVGSIYMTTEQTEPGTIFGGTWVRLTDRVLIGAGNTYANGTTGGAGTVTLNVNNLPSHSHGYSLTAASNGSHSHSLASTKVTAASSGAHTHTLRAADVTANSAGAHTHTATTASAGAHTHTRGSMNISGSTRLMGTAGYRTIISSSGAFSSPGEYQGGSYGMLERSTSDNQYADLNFDASNNWTGATSSNGAHTHTITVNSAGAHTHTVSGTTASAGAHTHTVSGTTQSAGAHTHNITGTINNTGGNVAVNIMPPYLAVNIWKRTA